MSLITTEQEEKIRRGELDVGLMRHPVYSPEIDYLELFDEPLVVVLPVDRSILPWIGDDMCQRDLLTRDIFLNHPFSCVLSCHYPSTI